LREHCAESSQLKIELSRARFSNQFSISISIIFFLFPRLISKIDSKPEVKNHYRGHKLSMWLSLIPQIHSPGEADLSMRHHHFIEENSQFYDGKRKIPIN
jgi:hypothetical protein